MSHELHVLRVFVDERGAHGNPLGVFLDGRAIPRERRQAIARELGFSETVFVDDAACGELRIFTPAVELPLAGHPLVGAGWLLLHGHPQLQTLRPPAGEVALRADGERVWITARAGQCPLWDLVQLATPGDVDALRGPPGDHGHAYVWAWEDEPNGRVRARAFAPDYGVLEDPATGSAAIVLCDHLARPLAIRQGTGSEIVARPAGDAIDLSGCVALDERRVHPG